MILVVADTGPLCYLILIEAVGLLPRMYDRVVIPSAVLAELAHPKAPAAVKTWAGSLPAWAEVRTAAHDELDDILDPGEAEAIILAEQLKADSLLWDEMEARREALRRGLPARWACWKRRRSAISSIFQRYFPSWPAPVFT